MGNNIAIPYSGFIPGGLHIGTDVVLNGRVPHNCERFSINLCAGPTFDQDCALHLNPRFDEDRVVRNHHQGGSWGLEEAAGRNPFRRGMGFEVHMKVTKHGYKITVNNKHFCDFNDRLPREIVKYIYIQGDVAINYIQFREHSHPIPHHGPHHGQHHGPHHGPPSYPSGPAYPPQPAVCPPGPVPSYPPAPVPGYPPAPVPGFPAGGAATPIYNPPVPFTSPIPGGLYPGKIMYISGMPRPNPSRFTVNILCGPSDDYDICLHFDVRFNYGEDYNAVVRTHKEYGTYGAEERQVTYFPFMPNANFEMMILAETSSFKIAVNNQHFVEFFHRIQPLQRGTHLSVSGDVHLSQVRFQ